MSEIDTIEKLVKENNNLVVLNILDLKEENGGIVDNTENFLSFKEIHLTYKFTKVGSGRLFVAFLETNFS